MQQQTPFSSSTLRRPPFIKIRPLPGKRALVQQDAGVTFFRRHWNTWNACPQKDHEYWRLSLPEQQPTLGVVRLQILIGQFKKSLDPLQRHFGLQDAVQHPRKRVEWNDQHSHQSQRGEHLPTDPERHGGKLQPRMTPEMSNKDLHKTQGLKEPHEWLINH